MSRESLTILQISANERRGGAEQVAWNLFDAYRRSGHRSYLVVGRGPSSDPDVIALSEQGRRGLAHALAGPGRMVDRYRGIETLRYPASQKLPGFASHKPDILHAHNLHGGYFDLRALPELARTYPVVLTLHDMWLLTGHCSHSLGCERWRTGCGACPDLTIYPAVRRDATHQNWERKRTIFSSWDRAFVATPSAWLMDRVRASILAPAIADARVIPNGVDLATFAPADRHSARDAVNLPRTARVLLFSGANVRRSAFKDFEGALAATAHAANAAGDDDVVLVVLGERGEPERAGRAEVRFIPFQDSPATLARYYQAADLYLHAARADTFPTTVLESLACGTPVVASAVGGIPEQVRSLTSVSGVATAVGADEATGALIAPGDAEGMGRVVADLLARAELRETLGRNAAADARRRFGLPRQRDAYLDWYAELLAQHPGAPARSRGRAWPDAVSR